MIQNLNIYHFTAHAELITQRIELFDKSLKYNYKYWRLENVVSIKIRKGEQMEKPDVGYIEGLSPAISIKHK